jgi:tetratricopeptide (TPR) repeat protein
MNITNRYLIIALVHLSCLCLSPARCLAESNADLLFNKGLKALEVNNYDSAIDSFTQVIRINGKNPSSYISRGTALYGKKNYSGAIEDYNTAIKLVEQAYSKKTLSNTNISSLRTLAYLNRGITYYSLNQLDLAKKDLDSSIYYNPLSKGIVNSNPRWLSQLSLSYLNRGNVYSAMNKQGNAIEDYTKAISIDENNIQAYLNRSSIYYDQGNYQKALDDVQNAIMNLNNSSKTNTTEYTLSRAYNKLGAIYLSSGFFDRASDSFEKAIKLNPNDGDIYYNKGLLYSELRDNALALESFNLAKEIYQREGNEDGKQRVLNAVQKLD